jgi:hypothetical protein
LDLKEQNVRAFSAYRQAVNDGHARVTVYDARSGKKLASYSSLSGVTIEQ